MNEIKIKFMQPYCNTHEHDADEMAINETISVVRNMCVCICTLEEVNVACISILRGIIRCSMGRGYKNIKMYG